mmetsp:Transcript_2964/g.9743  ORF Transcript_2964/g.9743 Transcript_2964/m.9743 type:complete len:202 (-) Transcript_2964:468-1073(-)
MSRTRARARSRSWTPATRTGTRWAAADSREGGGSARRDATRRVVSLNGRLRGHVLYNIYTGDAQLSSSPAPYGHERRPLIAPSQPHRVVQKRRVQPPLRPLPVVHERQRYRQRRKRPERDRDAPKRDVESYRFPARVRRRRGDAARLDLHLRAHAEYAQLRAVLHDAARRVDVLEVPSVFHRARQQRDAPSERQRLLLRDR